MNWLIAADSSCDLHTMETGAKDIVFHTVPFTVTLDHKEYRDTDDLDIPEMVDVMERSAVCRTACPSVGAWFELFERAEATAAPWSRASWCWRRIPRCKSPLWLRCRPGRSWYSSLSAC